MSRTITYYCSCSTCTQIRNEQPKHYRYINFIRYFFKCSCFLPKRKLMIENPSTITFREIDITNKHCSKHDVMVKAPRPHLSKMQNEELRQRVKEANQRWTRMSILPTNLIDFIFQNKDLLPICRICYENLSPTTFNLCYRCITILINYQQQIDTSQFIIHHPNRNTLSISSNSNDENVSEEIEQFYLDYLQQESFS